MAKAIDITNKKFGRLTAIKQVPRLPEIKHTRLMWECICDCGKTKIVAGKFLRNGTIQSCGCLQKETQCKNRKKPRGESGLSTIVIRYKNAAKQRKLSFSLTREDIKRLTSQNCYYCGIEPSQKSYGTGKYRTQKGFEDSLYIYNGIDRIDNNKGYYVNNCVSCCITCNRAKLKMSEKQFIKWIYRVVEFQESKK